MLLSQLITMTALALAATQPAAATVAEATPSPDAPALTALAAADSADKPAPKNAEAPAAPDAKVDTANDAKPDPADPADPLLESIEKKAATIKSLKARLRWTQVSALRGDETTRFGELVYVARQGKQTPAKFAAHFERTWIDGSAGKKVPIKQNRWYIYDGTWLVEKLEDKKQFIKRQIGPLPADRAKSEASEDDDPLTSGKGPFILPLSLRKDRIKQRFKVEVIKVDADDLEKDEQHLKNTVILRLTPRPPRQMQYTVVDLWYDKDTLLPVRVITEDKRENEAIIDLFKHDANGEIDAKLFDVVEPKSGWNVTVTPWKK